MKKYGKILGTMFLISCQLTSVVFANGDVCDVKKSAELGKCDIVIETKPNASVLVQILPASKSLNALDNENTIGDSIKYFRNVVADENGKASISVEIEDSGEYMVYAKFDGNDQIDADDGNKIYFVTKDKYEDIIERLNEKLSNDDFDGFKAILLNKNDNGIDNTQAIGFPSDLTIDYDKAIEMLYNNVKTSLMGTDAKKNSALVNACIGIEALKENKTDNAFPFLEEYLNISAEFEKFSSKHIKNETAEKKFSAILKNELKTLTNAELDQIAKPAQKALILTVVNYPENAGTNIKEVMNAYKGILAENGLNTLSENVRVYDLLKGKNLSTIQQLVAEYNSALATVNNQGSSGGGGGSSSGGGGGASASGGNTTSDRNPDSLVHDGGLAPSVGQKLDMDFEDLDGVDWAYSAISRLYEKKIISGYSENQFKPSNKVKREEFVKMLVCAMGLDGEVAENTFKDTKGDWSENYVAVAFKRNLVKGISEGVFGKGREISRQDMSVMIYNALLASGYKPAGHSYNFDDAAAEYAKTAIAELSGLGIVSGVGDNKFNPTANSTRAEAAVIIDRALNYFNKGE